MINYLLKILVLLSFSIFILFNYYFIYWGHLTSFDWYIAYLAILWIAYSVYKYFQLQKSKEIALFKNTHILGYFIFNLFVVSIYFFAISPTDIWQSAFVSGVVLFVKILFFSILPISIFVITTSFARFLLQKLPNYDDLSYSFNFLSSLSLWLVLFVTSLVILWSLWLYNIFVVVLLLWVFWFFARNQILDYYKEFTQKEYRVDIKEWSYLRLLSTEFFALLSFFVLSVALVSIFRPFPIGWDDLGVYMNYPHLMAEAGNILSLTSMYSWQVFTWIGYMFGNPTVAFFINISWLFISFFVLNIVFKELLSNNKDTDSKTFINLPLALSTIFISLPMITFLATKDMKVDAGLFFLTVTALFMTIKYFVFEKDNTDKKLSLIYIFIIWLVAWFAFSVKFTALMLIVWLIAVISFARLGFLWFLWFLGIFFGFFTAFWLWSMMNVVINPYNIAWFESIFSWVSIVVWIVLLWAGFLSKRNNSIRYIKEILIFLAWVVLILTPWFAKNIYESYPNLSVNSILKWYGDNFRPDYTNIYNDDELKEIREFYSNERKKENLITTNEDKLRYFGYSNGILDYVYMPWNLTMQKNQSWEYTDIWFLFLALLPLIFIFLRYKHPLFPLFFVLLAFVQFISYLPASNDLVKSQSIDSISQDSLSWILVNNEFVFDIDSDKNIYQINFEKYIKDEDLAKTIWDNEIQEKTRQYIIDLSSNDARKAAPNWTPEEINNLISEYSQKYLDNFEEYQTQILANEIQNLKKSTLEVFFKEIKQKVVWTNTGSSISFMAEPLDTDDMTYINELNDIYNNTYVFLAQDKAELDTKIQKSDLNEQEANSLINNWDNSRNISWKIIDFFSLINIPVWYLYVFLWFFIPTAYLIFTLKQTRLNQIFILNLVFASIYTFLWMISSFGIVWYGITMYFSFLLMILLAGYNIINYDKYEQDQKDYSIKMFISFIFLSIFLIYVFNSIIPNTFNNLKSAWYSQYKAGQVSSDESIFAYHPDYMKILFTLNIDSDKKQEFLSQNISKEIVDSIPKILDMEITTIESLLKSLEKQPEFARYANISRQNLYKNIANPSDEFKNESNIYRVGTFLKYYISQNNSRLLEDSLLFKFNDYIYSQDDKETINRFKSLWIEYLLVDLNAATIDKSDTKDLTNRYEKMLKTFTSPNLELVSTDSICLQVWLERYSENQNMEEYMLLAWTNYESYDEDWNQINRLKKRNECARYIDFLLENDKVTQENYSYLLPYKNYFEGKQRTVSAISNLIGTSYKALFEIK